jgi:hypothetical protein
MADVQWADRHAVDGIFIREMLLRDWNEVSDECLRDRRFGAPSLSLSARREVRHYARLPTQSRRPARGSPAGCSA